MLVPLPNEPMRTKRRKPKSLLSRASIEARWLFAASVSELLGVNLVRKSRNPSSIVRGMAQLPSLVTRTGRPPYPWGAKHERHESLDRRACVSLPPQERQNG